MTLTAHMVLANLETRPVVGGPAAGADQFGVALWHELGCDADADDAAAKALGERLIRAGQQAQHAVALVAEQA